MGNSLGLMGCVIPANNTDETTGGDGAGGDIIEHLRRRRGFAETCTRSYNPLVSVAPAELEDLYTRRRRERPDVIG
jgi:hypothetical protein